VVPPAQRLQVRAVVGAAVLVRDDVVDIVRRAAALPAGVFADVLAAIMVAAEHVELTFRPVGRERLPAVAAFPLRHSLGFLSRLAAWLQTLPGWLALVLSAIALSFTWRSRSDKKRVALVLVLSQEMREMGSAYQRIGVPTWTLLNAGEGSIMNPVVEVRDSANVPPMTFMGSGVLHGRGELRIVPVGDVPGFDSQAWTQATASASWIDGQRRKSAPVSITRSYV